MEPKERIRLLNLRLVQIEHELRTAHDLSPNDEMQADVLLQVIGRVIHDTSRRQIEKRAGNLHDWAEIAGAIGLANVALARMQETDAEALQGWKFERPQNPEQKAFSFVWALLLDLGQSAVEIEDQHPHMQHFFTLQREEIRQTYKLDLTSF